LNAQARESFRIFVGARRFPAPKAAARPGPAPLAPTGGPGTAVPSAASPPVLGRRAGRLAVRTAPPPHRPRARRGLPPARAPAARQRRCGRNRGGRSPRRRRERRSHGRPHQPVRIGGRPGSGAGATPGGRATSRLAGHSGGWLEEHDRPRVVRHPDRPHGAASCCRGPTGRAPWGPTSNGRAPDGPVWVPNDPEGDRALRAPAGVAGEPGRPTPGVARRRCPGPPADPDGLVPPAVARPLPGAGAGSGRPGSAANGARTRRRGRVPAAARDDAAVRRRRRTHRQSTRPSPSHRWRRRTGPPSLGRRSEQRCRPRPCRRFRRRERLAPTRSGKLSRPGRFNWSLVSVEPQAWWPGPPHERGDDTPPSSVLQKILQRSLHHTVRPGRKRSNTASSRHCSGSPTKAIRPLLRCTRSRPGRGPGRHTAPPPPGSGLSRRNPSTASEDLVERLTGARPPTARRQRSRRPGSPAPGTRQHLLLPPLSVPASWPNARPRDWERWRRPGSTASATFLPGANMARFSRTVSWRKMPRPSDEDHTPRLGPLRFRQAGDVVAVDPHGAAAGASSPAATLRQRALPCAVGAEGGGATLPAGATRFHVAEHGRAAVPGGDVAGTAGREPSSRRHRPFRRRPGAPRRA